jgi:hypothetical protein
MCRTSRTHCASTSAALSDHRTVQVEQDPVESPGGRERSLEPVEQGRQRVCCDAAGGPRSTGAEGNDLKARGLEHPADDRPRSRVALDDLIPGEELESLEVR